MDTAKFQFSIQQGEGKGRQIIDFSFNQKYGIHIQSPDLEKPYYLDLNLFNS